jgi:hypothetical protein
MCLLLSLVLFGPRFVILVHWLAWPARWDLAFDSPLVPIAGFLIAPWTTLVYVGVAPGGVDGLDFFLLGLAVAADLASIGGGGSYSRSRQGQHPQRLP